MHAELAIVLLNYNGKKHLENYLPSVVEHSAMEHPIYVIDNGSTDDSIRFVEQNFPSVGLIKLDQNFGFAGGYNKGLEHVDASYFALINTDIRVTPEWDTTLLNTIKKNPQIGVVCPKIKSDTHPEFFEYAGAAGGFLDRLGYAFCRGRIFDTIETDAGQYDQNRAIDWAGGCAFVISSKLFNAIGGFDASFFAHYEEIDLCWRVRRAGYQIFADMEAVVFHLGGGSLSYGSPFKTYLNFRNSLICLIKNDGHFGRILSRLLLDGVAGLQFLIKLEFGQLWSIVKAHFYVYTHIFGILKRKREQTTAITSTTIGSAIGNQLNVYSIVWKYFAKGIKTFKALIEA